MADSSFYIRDQEQLIKLTERLKSEAEQGTLKPITVTVDYKDGTTATYRLSSEEGVVRLDRPDGEPH